MFNLKAVRRLVCIGVLLATLALVQTDQKVGAASWSIRSYVDCFTTSVAGTAVLDWSGYSITAQGNTTGWLWKWDGSDWIEMSIAGGSNQGSEGAAIADTSTSKVVASYSATGRHTANFFSGSQDSYGASRYCS